MCALRLSTHHFILFFLLLFLFDMSVYVYIMNYMIGTYVYIECSNDTDYLTVFKTINRLIYDQNTDQWNLIKT